MFSILIRVFQFMFFISAIYCMDCFTDINNLCTVCMSPVDYGDLSDMSEERSV